MTSCTAPFPTKTGGVEDKSPRCSQHLRHLPLCSATLKCALPLVGIQRGARTGVFTASIPRALCRQIPAVLAPLPVSPNTCLASRWQEGPLWCLLKRAWAPRTPRPHQDTEGYWLRAAVLDSPSTTNAASPAASLQVFVFMATLAAIC